MVVLNDLLQDLRDLKGLEVPTKFRHNNSMKNKNTDTIYLELQNHWGEDVLNQLQKNAIKDGHNLKDKEEYKAWIVEYALNSLVDLMEEYEVEL